MSRRAILFVPALVVSLGVCSMASAQTPAVVTIDVDAKAAGTPLEPVWAFYGYDEVNYTTTPEGEELLRTLSAAHTAPVHIRTHFLFNTGDGMPALKWGSTNIYTEDAGDNPVYDYTLIDQIMDATARSGGISARRNRVHAPGPLDAARTPTRTPIPTCSTVAAFIPRGTTTSGGRS